MNYVGFTPHADQREKINLIEQDEVKYIVLTTGRQWGKTLLGMNLLLKWALENPKSTLMWVSPIYKQSKNVLGMLSNAILGTPIVESINRSDMEVYLINGSKILFRSAERADNLRGATLDYLVVDEAAFIADEVWDLVLKQTTMVKGKKVLFISTPRGKNFLFNLYLKGLDESQPLYLSLKGTSYDTPYISKEELDEAKTALPTDVFAQEILAEFIDTGGEVFKDIDTFCTLPTFQAPISSKKYYAGLDLGRTNDWSVLTILDEDGNVVDIYRERQKSWDYIVERVVERVKRYNATLLVEVNNIGDVIYEQIKKRYTNADPFVTTNSSKQNIIEDIIYATNEGNLRLPTGDTFPPLYSELKAFSFEYSPRTRQVRYEAQGGHHDDCVMSLAIAYNALKQKKTKGTYYVY